MNPERTIQSSRRKLDRITKDLIRLVYERNKLAIDVGKAKKKMNLKVTDIKREKMVIDNAKAYARKMKVDSKLIEKLMKILMSHARKLQMS